MTVYTEEQIESQLSKLNVEWTVVDGIHLQRVFTFEDFNTALAFVNALGKIAEAENHHPEIELSWGKVVLSISTHSEGGLTEKDFAFARAVEKI